jgi:hypothetical protein
MANYCKWTEFAIQKHIAFLRQEEVYKDVLNQPTLIKHAWEVTKMLGRHFKDDTADFKKDL